MYRVIHWQIGALPVFHASGPRIILPEASQANPDKNVDLPKTFFEAHRSEMFKSGVRKRGNIFQSGQNRLFRGIASGAKKGCAWTFPRYPLQE